MTNQFRAMCAELVDELHAYKVAHSNHDTGVIDRARALLAQSVAGGLDADEMIAAEREACAQICDKQYERARTSTGAARADACATAIRARALLAQPVAERPTDEEIEEWADACSEAPLEEMDPEVHGWRRCFTAKEFSETIRAALARFGRPTPQPPADGEVAELVEWLQSMRDLAGEHNPDEQRRYTRAADLLERPTPQPVAEGPTDDELHDLWMNSMEPGEARNAFAFTRAAIAADRARRPTPQPPADGEVGELVETLKGIAYWRRHGTIGGPPPAPFDIRQADRLDRAADLLERLASPCYVLDADTGAIASLKAAGPGRFEALPVLVPAAQPVAVSERLPGPEDCEAGECWAWDTAAESWNRTHYALCNHFTHWLPSSALPLPYAL